MTANRHGAAMAMQIQGFEGANYVVGASLKIVRRREIFGGAAAVSS
jgi:hypothetical protein